MHRIVTYHTGLQRHTTPACCLTVEMLQVLIETPGQQILTDRFCFEGKDSELSSAYMRDDVRAPEGLLQSLCRSNNDVLRFQSALGFPDFLQIAHLEKHDCKPLLCPIRYPHVVLSQQNK